MSPFLPAVRAKARLLDPTKHPGHKETTAPLQFLAETLARKAAFHADDPLQDQVQIFLPSGPALIASLHLLEQTLPIRIAWFQILVPILFFPGPPRGCNPFTPEGLPGIKMHPHLALRLVRQLLYPCD